MDKRNNRIKHKIGIWQEFKRFLHDTDLLIIHWPDFAKGILLLFFALIMLFGHWAWYICNYASENRIWLSSSYYEYRMMTTVAQIILVLIILAVSLALRKSRSFRTAMGFCIPLYFGLNLIFSGYTVGIYSPAVMAGTVNIVLIGCVLYRREIIYSIAMIVGAVIVWLSYQNSHFDLQYAPLFSDTLNQGDFYRNPFWINSMVLLYIPILCISALFFELLLSQWRKREKKIEILSQLDSLTNVFNRRYITDYLNRLHKKRKSNYALIILDLDFFKRINDNFGHDVGDIVLRSISELMLNTLRAQDIVGRMGGEEFVLVLPNTNLNDALQIAERCRRLIEQKHIQIGKDQLIKVTASFGVAVADEKSLQEEVYTQADQALYLAKQRGRNQVSHYLEVNDIPRDYPI